MVAKLTFVFSDLVVVGEMEFLVTKNHFISVKEQACSAAAGGSSDKTQAASSSSKLLNWNTTHVAIAAAVERVLKFHIVLSNSNLLHLECRFENSCGTSAIPAIGGVQLLHFLLELISDWVV